MKQLNLDGIDGLEEITDNRTLLASVFDALLYDQGLSVREVSEITGYIAARLNIRLNNNDRISSIEDDAVINLSNMMSKRSLDLYLKHVEINRKRNEMNRKKDETKVVNVSTSDHITMSDVVPSSRLQKALKVNE